jgi:HEAT repeat protein
MRSLFWLALVFSLTARPVLAYVDVTPTLGAIINNASAIAVLRVAKVNREKRAILFEKVADLKGSTPADVRHHVADGYHPREPRLILDWAEPGKIAVSFTAGTSCVVCIGDYWYECAALEGPWWSLLSGRPELSVAYQGPAEKLRDAIPPILDGKEVIVTAVNHGSRSGTWQYSNVAFQKVLRGKDCPVWRIRASLDMPTRVWRVGDRDSRWVVGPGVAGPEDVPQLVGELANTDAGIRACAADALGLVGWAARSALPALRCACGDTDPLVRVSAARSVIFLGSDPSPGLRVLRAALGDEQPRVRKEAAVALGDLGTQGRAAVHALREALTDKDENVRWSAAEALGRIGPGAEAAVPGLAAALRDSTIRAIAADSLGSIGPAARGAVPLLLDALRDEDADFRWAAAVALSRIDAKSARAAVPLFVERFTKGDFRARWDVLMILTPMGREAEDAADAVRVMVRRGNGVAAATLAAIAGPDAIDALPTLLHVLADDWDTSEDIAHIGPAAVPQVQKLLADATAPNRHLAVKTLALLAPQSPEVIPVLIEALTDANPAVRTAAAVALGHIEPRVKQADPALIAALKDEEPNVRLAAAAALRNIQGPRGNPAIPALTDLLSHEEAVIRREAAAALAEFGAAARSAVPSLNERAQDSDVAVRSAAARAVARITSAKANQHALTVLVAALKDHDPAVRLHAVRFLGAMGPDARSAVAAVGRARHDEDDEVRKAAAEALQKIAGK